MRFNGLLDNLPLWLLFVATVGMAFLSCECGFRVGRWRSRQSEQELEVVVRSLVAAMLGLLTFILAFTFWIAATHFDAARQAKLNEANAIRTAYLRADMLPEPHRAEIRDLLRQYVNVRLEAIRLKRIEAAIARSEELHGLLWSQAVAAREKTSSPIFAGYFVQSLNEVMDLHTRRVTIGSDFRIPNAIWFVLYLMMMLSVASIGFYSGLTKPNRPLVIPAFILLFSAAMLLIADLDRPGSGWLRISRQALLDLQRTMSVSGP